MALSSMASSLPALSTRDCPQIPGVQVKAEQEDPDILRLAEQLKEANKAKALQEQQAAVNQVRPNPNGQGMLRYLNRVNPPEEVVSTPSSEDSKDSKPPVDIKSRQGKFGWTTIDAEHIPYLLRGEDKFVSVRLMDMKLLCQYLKNINSSVYAFAIIRSYYITEFESKLLTEINAKHCDFRFGQEPFTTKDLVVPLSDAIEFYEFLKLAYTKLSSPLSQVKERCGFIRINNDSVVPYTVRNGNKLLPLFYFEGETENLRQKADKLDHWDLVYLKFCCKVQGIRSELFASDSCFVISLTDIKSYFPSGTVFDEYWPPKLSDPTLLISQPLRTETSWIQAPRSARPSPPQPVKEQPPPPALQQIQPPTITQNSHQLTNGWGAPAAAAVMPPSSQLRFQPATPASQPRVQATPISVHSASHVANNINRTVPYQPRVQQPIMTPQQYYSTHGGHTNLGIPTPPSHMVQGQPPPLVRATSANPAIGSPTYSTPPPLPVHPHSAPPMSILSSTMMPPPPHMQYATHNNNNSNQAKYPPPLIPVNGSQRYYGTGSDIIDLSSPPQSPQRSLLANGKLSCKGTESVDGWINLIPIIESSPRPTTNQHPFKIQKALVSGKMVPCINAKPHMYSELLMTVNDLLEYFFPHVSISKCREVIQNVLKLNLYSGNLQQKTVLRDNNKCKTLNEVLPLIQLKDVVNYMPQMKYALASSNTSDMNGDMSESAAKRQRVS